jgi:glyoxylase-like metal-dependent hydrolase (beta-lactamase superfamily II)
MVTRVETKVPDAVLGEAPLIATYSDYADHNGVKFPSRIVEEQGGFMILDVNVDSVQPGAAVDLPVPAPVASAAVPPVTVTSTRLANGVWHLTGGSHHSVAVEFAGFLAVVEGPQSPERGAAVIAEAKKLAPGKPVRYVISTHHHFDHSGGLRPFVTEGAAIVTHQSNVEYFAAAFGPMAKFQAVTDTYEITDGAQRMEVHATMNDTHTDELLVAYLPNQRILVEADSYSPNDPNARPMPPPPNAVVLYDNLERLKLNVTQIAPIHGRGAVPIAEFRRFVGR